MWGIGARFETKPAKYIDLAKKGREAMEQKEEERANRQMGLTLESIAKSLEILINRK